jgi:uncharacterized protein YbaP (TraB family)
MRKRLAALGRAAFLCAAAVFASATARADATLHPLWEVHGKHNTVYLLGSIHVLRPADYPLAPAVLDAYGHAKALVMEIDMGEMDQESVQAEMVASAQLPEGKTLPQVLGTVRYAHARQLASQLGVELSTFDGFAPWFVAEAISQLQLAQLGFQPESGVEMYFLGRARTDGKPVTGLETAHDQIAVFESLSMDTQAEYLVSSLEEAGELPKEVDAMVHAWQRGDTQWFAGQLRRELGRDPAMYQSLLAGRNRRWIPRIEALLGENEDYLVIVGTGHLAGSDSVIELLRKDGFGVVQR